MDENEIREVIQAYFDSGYTADEKGMSEVFHDGSHLYTIGKDGELVDWEKEFFVKRVGTTETGFPRYNEILSIDFVGEGVAVARVKVRVRDTLFTDILCFVRLNGKWGVISKVFAGVPAE